MGYKTISVPNTILTRDGNALFHRDWGTGRPVVFLAAWAMASDMWAYQMLPFSREGLRCIAYDRRGHGRSSDPGGGYDYNTLSDDLADVLEALDLRGVTLVGMSMASGEIVRYLTRHGSARIDRIVLLAPAATPFLTRTADNALGVEPAVLDQMRAGIFADLPGWIDANAAGFVTPDVSDGMVRWLKGLMLGHSLQALEACNRACMGTDFRSELSAIDVPTLVIHGDADQSAPLDLTGRPTAASIPGASLKIYEGAPHGLFITHTTRLNADLRTFIGA